MTGQQATEHRVMCLLGPVTVELSTDQPVVVDYLAEFYPITTTVSGKPDWVADARVGPGGGMRRNAYGVAYAADPGVRTVVVRADDPLNLAMTAAGAGHGRALREMDSLFKEHPGALVTTPAAYPLALVRLAHALIEAGYLTVAAPACAGCGNITADLRRKTASGRVCGTCAARDSEGTCARCGQPGGSTPGVPRAVSARPATTRTSRS